MTEVNSNGLISSTLPTFPAHTISNGMIWSKTNKWNTTKVDRITITALKAKRSEMNLFIVCYIATRCNIAIT